MPSYTAKPGRPARTPQFRIFRLLTHRPSHRNLLERQGPPYQEMSEFLEDEEAHLPLLHSNEREEEETKEDEDVDNSIRRVSHGVHSSAIRRRAEVRTHHTFVRRQELPL